MGCNCRKSTAVPNKKDFCSSLGLLSQAILVESPTGEVQVYMSMPDGTRMELAEAIRVWRCAQVTTGSRLAEMVLSALARTNLRKDTLTSLFGRPVALNLLRERLEAASR